MCGDCGELGLLLLYGFLYLLRNGKSVLSGANMDERIIMRKEKRIG